MTIDFDQIDDAFISGAYQASWRSPAEDNQFNSHSHYIILQDGFAIRACRTVSDSVSFDLQDDADFKLYPPCKACQQQVIKFTHTNH